ncbi:MAG: RNA polymerase sigma factor [Thermoleophilia bacterium]
MTAIYRDLSPDVLRYLRARGAREPEDLLGEVFIQVVRKIQDFEGEEREFHAWVFTIAHHRMIDEWRCNRRNLSDPVPDYILASIAPSGNSEEDVILRLRNHHVHSVIERLSPDQRDVLLLRIIAGLTIEEVALILNKRPGAIKSLQLRGLAAIRREISKGAVSI